MASGIFRKNCLTLQSIVIAVSSEPMSGSLNDDTLALDSDTLKSRFSSSLSDPTSNKTNVSETLLHSVNVLWCSVQKVARAWQDCTAL